MPYTPHYILVYLIKHIMIKKLFGNRLMISALLALFMTFPGIIKGQECEVNPSFSTDQYCDSVIFQNTSTVNLGSIDSVQWFFGIGDTLRVYASFFDPVYYLYPVEGSFYVFMHVFNSEPCDTSFVDTVNVFRPEANFSVVAACLNEPTLFTDLSLSNSDSLILWDWDFGDFGNSSLQSPSHIYTSSNSYNIQLKVTNNYMCADSITKLRVIENPVAGFYSDTACFGSVTHFTDTSTYIQKVINQWSWDFGDGTTSILKNPTHTFLTPGIHTVTLTVANTLECFGSVTQDIFIPVSPETNFIIGMACPKDTVYFTDASVANNGTLVGWDWDFGDGSPHAFVDDTSHVYAIGGTYNISLTVTNSFSCSDDSVFTITFDKPNADFEFDSVCFGLQTHFSDLSTFNPNSPITSWKWDFSEGGTSQANDTVYTFGAPGVYPVELIIGNETGCSDTIVHDVLVNDLPIANFSYTASCAGLQTCFTDLTIPNADTTSNWIWFFGDGSSTVLQNPCHIYSDTGTYIVTLLVNNTNGCSAIPHQDTIYVSYRPEADFEFTEGCLGDSTYFTNLSDSLSYDLNYFWNFGDPTSGANNNSLLTDPVHFFNDQKSYQVKLVAQNNYGCVDSLVKIVAIDSIPQANFIAPDTIAVGVEFTITDLSQAHGSPILARTWDFGDGTVLVNINPVIHTFDSTGLYFICLTVNDFNGCSHSFCDSIYVIGLPVANFVYASDISFETFFYDASTPEENIVDWFWDFGDLTTTSDTISHVAEPSYTFPAEGWYNVYLQITDRFGGKRDTIKPVYAGNAVVSDFYEEGHCLGSSTIFIDNSYSPISTGFQTWYWDFGDGDELTLNEPVDTVYHSYAGPGIYHVKYGISATINGFFMSDTMYREVGIYESPIARIDTNNIGVCFGQTINFHDLSNASADPITKWLWDFDTPQADSSYIQNPSFLYEHIGDYSVKMSVVTNHGCTDIDSVVAHVSYAPSFPFKVLHPCINSQTAFVPQYDSTQLKINAWSWSFGDAFCETELNTSTERSPKHVFSRILNYTVTMSMSAYGCPGTYENTILVFPIPYSNFNITPDYEDIQGKTLFTNNSIYANSYLWDFGNGHTSTIANPVEVYEQDSLYTVTLISTNEYTCSDTSRQNIRVFFKGLYFPTAFSPGNPNQEVSRFVPKGVNLKEYLVQVFDVRGNLLWESDKVDKGGSPVEIWDGYYNGILMPQGTYVWKASAMFKDGTSWKGQSFDTGPPKTNGTVTLIK